MEGLLFVLFNLVQFYILSLKDLFTFYMLTYWSFVYIGQTQIGVNLHKISDLRSYIIMWFYKSSISWKRGKWHVPREKSPLFASSLKYTINTTACVWRKICSFENRLVSVNHDQVI